MNIDVINQVLREELDLKLKSFGLRIAGGSYDWDTGTWWIGLDSAPSVSYNQHRVAAMLMDELDERKLVLDGIHFTKQSLKERLQNWQNLRRTSPKKALA